LALRWENPPVSAENRCTRDFRTEVSRARYYSQQIGRFWTADDFEGSEEKPQSLNKYIYCYDNPVNRKDPTGHFTEIEIEIAAPTAAGVDAGAATAAAVARAFAMRRLQTAVARWAFSTAVQMAAVGVTVAGYEGLTSYETSQELERINTQTAQRANPTGSSHAYHNLECESFATDAKKYFKEKGDEPEFIRFQAYEGKIRGDFIWASLGLLSGKMISESGSHFGCLVDGRVYDNNVPFGVSRRVWEKYSYRVAPKDQPVGVFLNFRKAVKQGYGEIDFPASAY
jgi:RHS repeat-associated protein